ncbi:MAG: hypothetical protein IPK83_12940 [Planctomycetes bacterium]|nr:hypothetical protein [Planctomycetota bacterium]
MHRGRNKFIARLIVTLLALTCSQSVLHAESPTFDAVARSAPPMPRPNPAGVDTGACCIGAVDCIIITQFDCEDEGHTWLGPDTLCVNCPALPQCPESGVLLAQQVYDPTVFSSATTSEIGSNFSVFDHFSGVAGAVESLTWWGLDMQPVGNHFEECEETNNTFIIAFHSGDAGQPGNVVCSWLVNATRTPLNIRYFGAELNEYHAVLPAPCVLTRGWVSIIGAGDPQCWFIWMSSPDGDDQSYCDGCTVGPQSSDYAVCLHGEVGGIYGACCHDASSTCMDEKVEIAQCLGDGMRFAPNETCNSLTPPCGTVFGRCCIFTFECSIETLDEVLCWAETGSRRIHVLAVPMHRLLPSARPARARTTLRRGFCRHLQRRLRYRAECLFAHCHRRCGLRHIRILLGQQ